MQDKINLGCPKYCSGYTCVDLHPKDSRVIKDEASCYLYDVKDASYIRAFNLIEHLPNVGMFFGVAHSALKDNGVLDIRTDNAFFLPFHFNVIHMLGFGAHCSNQYNKKIMNGSRHYSLFTKLHLQNYCKRFEFEIISLRYELAYSRLRLIARKI